MKNNSIDTTQQVVLSTLSIIKTIGPITKFLIGKWRLRLIINSLYHMYLMFNLLKNKQKLADDELAEAYKIIDILKSEKMVLDTKIINLKKDLKHTESCNKVLNKSHEELLKKLKKTSMFKINDGYDIIDDKCRYLEKEIK